jgi:hypothetical protein
MMVHDYGEAPRHSTMPLVELDSCLFCGVALDDLSRTREDIFPGWLQREYEISDRQLTLLNGTYVRYRSLLVPACNVCNNVHASQLEQRVKQDCATYQDIWIWLLKLQLGTMAFETSIRWARDRRDPLSEEPIVDASVLDLGFLHSLFDTLKVEKPQYAPNPLGSVFSFATTRTDFFYADMLYRHPASAHDHNYGASCICIHGRCYMAFFDDGGNMLRNVDLDAMSGQVAEGYDPVLFFPDLMYERARFDYMPQTLVIARRGGPTEGVTFVPPISRPNLLPHDDEVRSFYREQFLREVDVDDLPRDDTR